MRSLELPGIPKLRSGKVREVFPHTAQVLAITEAWLAAHAGDDLIDEDRFGPDLLLSRLRAVSSPPPR